MNYALIFAGGTGQRMNSKSKPKQFLELHGKPLIIHTIEFFENSDCIDAICVVCLHGWERILENYIKKYSIQKVKWIVKGGITGHESIYEGLRKIGEVCNGDDIVLIHDGVRPLISEELIQNNIECVKKFGNAITVETAAESIVQIDEEGIIKDVPPRNEMRIAKAPQGFYFQEIMQVHEQAIKDNFKSIDSAHLLSHYGHTLHTIESTPYNIKIATPSDYYVFRALYEARENSQIFGL